MNILTAYQVRVYNTFNGVRDLVIRKSRNYGEITNLSEQFLCPDMSAVEGLYLRLGDKIRRLRVLRSGEPDVVGESIKDIVN